jgi:peptide/nickel transport system permease protein
MALDRESLIRATHLTSALRRMKKNKGALAGTAIIFSIILAAVFARYISPYDPFEQDFGNMFLSPSLTHPFGTDQYGRDVATRIIYGARYDLMIGVAVVSIHFAVGVSLGLIAGFYGGIVETLIMRVVDVMLSIPSIVLALTIAGFLGGGIQNVIIAVGAIGWRDYTRLVRAEVLSAKENVFVEAAQAIGCSDLRIIVQHIMPYVIAPVIAYTTLGIATAILWSAALSFLGLGAQPPTPEWGAMLADGREFMPDAWWIATFPGLAIMATIIGFNFFGDALRSALDPKSDKRI